MKEGYRAWAVGFALSAATKGYQADVCYEFINWYLSGFVGGYLNRQGYYSAVPKTAKEYMADYEWDYWMLGKPATQDITAPDGKKLAGAGELRDGGSFEVVWAALPVGTQQWTKTVTWCVSGTSL